MIKLIKATFCYLVLITLLLACSTIKISKKGEFKADVNLKITEVLFLTQQDIVPKGSIEIGTFKMIENSTTIWDELAEKMVVFAKSKQSNIIKIDEYHMAGGKGSRGHQGFIKGRLYYNNTISLAKNTQVGDSIDIYVYRYEKDNFIASKFKIDLTINKQKINIKNRSVYKFKAKEGTIVSIANSQNPTNFVINVENKSAYYISVNKHVKSTGMQSNYGISAGVSIGGVDIKSVNEIEGKLEYENILQLNNHNH